MVLCNAEDVRFEILNLDISKAPDAKLNKDILRAQRELLQAIAVRRIDERMVGDVDAKTPAGIDGSTTQFFTCSHPVADITFDGVINASDVKVYTWTDRTKESTKSDVEVSSVNSYSGRVVLVVAPATSIDILTCDYCFYHQIVDQDVLKDVCKVMAAYNFIVREWYAIPEQVIQGSIRFRNVTMPYERLRKEKNRLMRNLRTGIVQGKPVIMMTDALRKTLEAIWEE